MGDVRKDVETMQRMKGTPEDIIIAKLVYGSEQDFDDALAILLVQKHIDKEYLQKRAGEEGVKDRLDKLLESE